MTMTIDYGTHVFEGQADGTVRVAMPPAYTIAITGNADSYAIAVGIDQTGANVLVSGTGDNLTTTYSAPKVVVSLREFLVEGTPLDLNAELALTNLAASYSTVGTDAFDIASRSTTDELVINVSGKPPEPGSGPFAVNARFAALETEGSGLLAGAMFSFSDMSDALAAGLRVDTVMRHGPASYELDIDSPEWGGRVVGRGGSDSGNLSVRLDARGFSYGGGNTGLTLAVEAAAMPLPDLSASLSETAFSLAMPLQQSDTPQDFGLLLRLRELAVSNTLWNLADPGSVLPRDPATLVIDIAGKANLLADILNPDFATPPTGGAPGELHALDIRSVEVTAVGASLTGAGAFTFDNTDLLTFDGIPRPQGGLDLRLAGGNGLIGRLSQMGLLPQEQVLAAQTILGLFARPTGEPDVVTSRIEVDASGTLVANGLPLPLP
jgi:hypothetical protein